MLGRDYFRLGFLILLASGIVLPISAQLPDKRPNIIVFMVDDMGWQDTSEPFWNKRTAQNNRYHTPHIECLARQGLKFTNAYATAVCTPTRVSLITGMNPARHRVTNWTSPRRDTPTDYDDEELAAPAWNFNGLSATPGFPYTVHASTLPGLLRAGGYYTIHIGKAHWGSNETPGANPLNLGFMVNVGGHAAGSPASYLGEENYGDNGKPANLRAVPHLETYHGQSVFLTEALTKEALKALDVPISRGQPFFLNMAHYAVHTPYNKDARFYQRYRDAGLDDTEAMYAALLEGVDQSLGDLMDFLEEKSINDNTVIIFVSDNGGLSLSPPRSGRAHMQNLPLRSGKGSVYEGGIRIPMIVTWPGYISPGKHTDQYVIIEDLFPTLLEIARIQLPTDIQQLDGRSLLSVFDRPEQVDSSRMLIWHMPNKWIPADGPGINFKSAIRRGNWKLIFNMRDSSFELYNLKSDIAEQVNVATKYPDILTQLTGLLSNQLREMNAQMPIAVATGKVLPWPDQSVRFDYQKNK